MHPPDAPPPGATLLDAMLEDMLRRRYLVVDGQGRISRWSGGAEALLGWREEEVVGRSAFGQPLAWAGDGVELWKSYFAASQAACPPAHATLMMLCRGGWGLSVEMTAVPVPLVLGYEFTMLVADLAVGGPGSQSEERLTQVHPLAADAIASALRDDAPAPDAVAGLLVTLRAVGDAAVIEDTDAQHAARALAIERDEAEDEGPALPDAEDDDTAEDLAEAHASLKAASTEVSRLREEIGSLRGRLGEEESAAQEARAEAGRLSAALDQAGAEAELARASAGKAQADVASLRAELDARAAELDAALASAGEAKAEVASLRAELESRGAELDGALAGRTEAARRIGELEAERDLMRGERDAASAEHERLRAELEAATSGHEGLRAELDAANAEHDRLQAELEAAGAGHEGLRAELDAASAEHERLRAELDAAAGEYERLHAELDAASVEQDELRTELDATTEGRQGLHAELDSITAERDRLTAELEAAERDRDELRRDLDAARAELADIAREHESSGAAANQTEREREALRAELERASRRCQELSVALDAKTAELQALPGQAALDAAKRDRDEARSTLAAALAERDRAAGALDDAAGERDSVGAALRQAEAERDEAQAALAAAASESEAAHAELAEHERRADELRSRLEAAERIAAERAAEVETATREAADARERVAAGHLETEALAHERARVSELEAQIASLTGELEGALARAAEHAPEQPATRGRAPAALSARRAFEPGLDDTGFPRAYIGLDGRFDFLNEAFCKLVGYSEAEFSGAHWPPVVDAEHRNALRRATARVIAGELSGCEVDTVYMAGNGTLVRVVGMLRLERDESGSARHLVLDARPLAAVLA